MGAWCRNWRALRLLLIQALLLLWALRLHVCRARRPAPAPKLLPRVRITRSTHNTLLLASVVTVENVFVTTAILLVIGRHVNLSRMSYTGTFSIIEHSIQYSPKTHPRRPQHGPRPRKFYTTPSPNAMYPHSAPKTAPRRPKRAPNLIFYYV